MQPQGPTLSLSILTLLNGGSPPSPPREAAVDRAPAPLGCSKSLQHPHLHPPLTSSLAQPHI